MSSDGGKIVTNDSQFSAGLFRQKQAIYPLCDVAELSGGDAAAILAEASDVDQDATK